MSYRVLIGADFGSTVVRSDGDRLRVDSHSKWQVALSVGAAFLPLETVDGVSLPGDAFTCDRDGNTPPLHVVVEMVRREAARYGALISHSELVGLIPQQALLDAATWYWQLDGFKPDQVLENRLGESSQ